MGLAAATIGAGVLGAGASVLSSSNSAKAAETAGQDTANATEYAANLQQQEYEQALQLEMPSYRVGQGALGLYASALGLPGYALEAGSGGSAASGTPSYEASAPAVADTSAMVQGAGKNNMFGGVSEGGITTDQANTILSARPDVLQAYNALPSNTKASFGNPQAYAAYWYHANGQNEGYQLASTPSGPAATTPSTGAGSLQAQNDSALSSVTGGQNIGALVAATPGYSTQLQQGVDAIQAADAARGTLNSGGVLKALDTYGQNTFGDYYQKWLGNVGSLAGVGTSEANTIGSQGQSTGASQGALAVQGATAQGQAGVNAANAWSSGLGGATGSLSGVLNNPSLYGGTNAASTFDTGGSLYNEGLI